VTNKHSNSPSMISKCIMQTGNRGRYFIAHAFTLLPLNSLMRPQAGAIVSCVEERIMLAIRLLMERKSIPIKRFRSPSAIDREPRKIFYNCTFTLLPFLEFSDRVPCWHCLFMYSGKNDSCT
jgi:hypothetical protein